MNDGLKGINILVVEDDADTRDLLKVLLEAQGAGVRVIEEINRISHGLSFRASTRGQQVGSNKPHAASPPAPLRHLSGRSHVGPVDPSDPNLDYHSYRRMADRLLQGHLSGSAAPA